MAFSEPEVICKKHPQHKQQPGVCSCCLREKLSKINGTSTIATISSSLSSSTSLSNCASPHGRGGHRRITSDGNYSFATLAAIGTRGGVGGGGGLKKSKSITFVARGGRVGINGKKKKEGFWSKLIWSTGKLTKRVIDH